MGRGDLSRYFRDRVKLAEVFWGSERGGRRERSS